MPTNPPPSFEDMLGDAEGVELIGPYHQIDVDKVGPVQARKPMPNAIPNLAQSARADVPDSTRTEHLNRFVRNHLNLGEADRLLEGMMCGDLPADTFSLVAQAIAVWGTARPT